MSAQPFSAAKGLADVFTVAMTTRDVTAEQLTEEFRLFRALPPYRDVSDDEADLILRTLLSATA